MEKLLGLLEIQTHELSLRSHRTVLSTEYLHSHSYGPSVSTDIMRRIPILYQTKEVSPNNPPCLSQWRCPATKGRVQWSQEYKGNLGSIFGSGLGFP